MRLQDHLYGSTVQPVLWCTWTLHGGIQWSDSWLPQLMAHKTWPVWPALRSNIEVKRLTDWVTMRTRSYLPSRREANLIFLGENQTENLQFITEGTVLPQVAWDQMTEGLVILYWSLRLFLTFMWWPTRVTECWHCVLPLKKLSAEFSSGCSF